jgi:hypothetical protein
VKGRGRESQREREPERERERARERERVRERDRGGESPLHRDLGNILLVKFTQASDRRIS